MLEDMTFPKVELFALRRHAFKTGTVLQMPFTLLKQFICTCMVGGLLGIYNIVTSIHIICVHQVSMNAKFTCLLNSIRLYIHDGNQEIVDVTSSIACCHNLSM